MVPPEPAVTYGKPKPRKLLNFPPPVTPLPDCVTKTQESPAAGLTGSKFNSGI